VSIVNSGLDVGTVSSTVRVPRGGVAKRLFDIAVGSLLLIGLLPLMFFVAVAAGRVPPLPR